MDKPIYLSGAPPSDLERWRAEVEALPPRKQAKWRKIGRNHEGTFRQVRYYQGYFQIKVLANTMKGEAVLPYTGWAPIVPTGGQATRDQVIHCYGLSMMQAIEAQFNQDPESLSRMSYPQFDRVAQAEARGGSEARNEELRRMMAENHTGKHHRNKSITIPTRPGQPVRG
jgi:hypothetical protein